MGIEQRRHERIDLDLPIRVLLPDGPRDGRIENLGPEGTFIILDDPATVPDEIQVELQLDNCLLPVEIGCEVKWRRESGRPGIGVFFQTINTFEKTLIGDFIYRVIYETKERLSMNE